MAIRLVFVAALAIAVVIFLSRGPNSILTGYVPPSQPSAVVKRDLIAERERQREAARSQASRGEDWATGFREVVLEAHALVAEHYYDTEKLEAVGWDALAVEPDEFDFDDLDQLLYDVHSNTGFPASSDVNRALKRLGASHTKHFHKGQREYYDLIDLFSESPALKNDVLREFPPDGRVTVASAGFTWGWFENYRHAINIFPGSVAEEAGMRPGDGMRAPEGNHGEDPLLFQLRRGPTTFDIDHLGPWHNNWEEVTLDPNTVNPTEEYLDLMTNSVKVIKQKRKRLGYVRIYSWAGQHYQDRLEELLQQEPLASADGVVLDIRGGWGGASPQYLDLFDAPMPKLTHMPRDGEAFVWDPSEDLPARTFYWRKPVVLLVDSGSRSGKEIIAYAFKKHAIGPVVGERTAGAVLAGRPFILSDGSLLYLAVADVLVDGERLEGVGVEPDIVVERELPFSNGADPQLDAAYGALVGAIGSR
jgi:carboxyl-terminal processing protease